MKKAGNKQRINSSEFILDRARDLFWLHGYAGTTIRDIANFCGFAPGNLYNYFSSKEEILYKILRDEMDSLISSIQPIEDDESASPIEQFRIFIRKHVFHTLGPVKGKMLLFEMEWRYLSIDHQREIIELRDIYDRILRKIILRGIDTGFFRKGNVKLFNYAVASLIVQARTTWYSPKGELNLSELSEAIFKLFLDGLKAR